MVQILVYQIKMCPNFGFYCPKLGKSVFGVDCCTEVDRWSLGNKWSSGSPLWYDYKWDSTTPTSSPHFISHRFCLLEQLLLIDYHHHLYETSSLWNKSNNELVTFSSFLLIHLHWADDFKWIQLSRNKIKEGRMLDQDNEQITSNR